MIEVGRIRIHKRFSPKGDSQGKEVSYKMCFLGKEALQDILELQNLIAMNLPTPELFQLHNEDYFREIFCRERAAVGVLTEQGLIAYSIIRIPGDGVDNLGRDIGLSQSELCKVAHLQTVAVHPNFRGNGLQQRMARYNLCVIEELGFLHVCCTVSVKNPVSLYNILSSGFIIKGLRPKFNGWWRYIMYKRNCCPIKKDLRLSEGVIKMIGSDINGQIDLLKQGFVGTDMAYQPDGFMVFYEQIRAPG